MSRIPPSRKIRQEIEKLLQGWETAGHPLDKFVRLGARYALQAALEPEVDDFLARAYYRRGSRQQKGWRNGYEPGKVKTAEGLLEVALPQRGIIRPLLFTTEVITLGIIIRLCAGPQVAAADYYSTMMPSLMS